MTYKKELTDNGVVLVKNAWDSTDVKMISDEYDRLDKTLTNKDIIKDKPIIVFWKHVVGEQKEFVLLMNFPLCGNSYRTKLYPMLKKF